MPRPIQDRLFSALTRVADRKGVVTADDAQRYLDRIDYRGNRTVIGSVLRRPNFRPRGYTKATTPSSKHRTIRVWAAA